MKIKPSLVIILTLLVAGQLFGQPVEELVREAIGDNPGIRALDLEYQAVLEQAPQVSQLPDPEFGAGVFPLPVETRLGAQQFRIGATQAFPWPGLLKQREEVALTRAAARFQQTQAAKLELAYQVKAAYFQLYELRRGRAIIRENLFLLETLERLALRRVESGKATVADVLSVRIRKEELMRELEVLEARELTPLATLNGLLNREADRDVIFPDSLSEAVIWSDKDALLSELREAHPLVRMYQLQQETAREAIRLNELEGRPDFGLGLDYIQVGQRSDASPERNGRDILQIRASVKVPVWREKYRAKGREESLRINALENRKKDLLNQFRSAIEGAYADFFASRINRRSYAKQIDLTRSAMRVLQADYSNDGTGFDELLRLEKDLIGFRRKLLEATITGHLAQSQLERYLIP